MRGAPEPVSLTTNLSLSCWRESVSICPSLLRLRLHCPPWLCSFLADEPGSMTVTWTTWVPTRSEVQFGLQLTGPLPLRAQGTFSPFVDGGVLRRKFYIHRVTLRGLLPGVQYGERDPRPRC